MVIYYFFILNLVSFLLMGLDKYKARRHAWRIQEKSFFLLAICGGTIGSLLGIYLFRHKTKHAKFTLGMPVILILQFVLLFYLLSR
ncbi:MAG: DUF1294 domain-containing protein [Lachnospiraceae bacterium]|nr:DUF1294 domain-containing protein [Lachnospiraceae bacterium]